MPRKTLIALVVLLNAAAFCKADGIIQTLIGSAFTSNVNVAGRNIGFPSGMVTDPLGNIYFTDSNNNYVRRIGAGTGFMTTVAGTGQAGYTGDHGPASQAQLNGPTGLAYFNNGTVEHLFLSDSGNDVVREIDLGSGVITTVAGDNILATYSQFGPDPGDGGPATQASLYGPGAIAAAFLNGYEQVFFVDGKNRVRTFIPGQGVLSTYAGSGSTTPAYNVAASQAYFQNSIVHGLAITCIAADANANLFLGYGGSVWEVVASGAYLSPVAGVGAGGPITEGVAAVDNSVGAVSGIYVDASDDVFLSSTFKVGALNPTYYSSIQEVNGTTNLLSDVAGSITVPAAYGGDNGLAINAGVAAPGAINMTANGDLYFVDSNNIRKVANSTQFISTVAGIVGELLTASENSVPANQYYLPATAVGPIPAPTPTDLLVATDNSQTGALESQIFLYHSATGLLSLFAGSGSPIFGGDGGPATAAGIGDLSALARDATGAIYFADGLDYGIRRIDPVTDDVSEVADATQVYGESGDGGLATAAEIGVAEGMVCSGTTLYFTDFYFDNVRGIDLTTGQPNSGKIFLVAGPEFTGTSNNAYDNGAATTTARFSSPKGIAADSQGNLYVADSGNNAVRKISAGNNAQVTTVCGLGPNSAGYGGDGGPAGAAILNSPTGVWLDTLGNLFVADTGNNRVRRVDAVTGIITTVVGNGSAGFSGDNGPGLSCELNGPSAGYVDASGNQYINDTYNLVVRKVTYYQSPTPTPISTGEGKPVAYPSPASSQICFSYYTTAGGNVDIEVYNMGFQVVERFTDSLSGPGPQKSCGDVSRLASGPYIYRMLLPDGTTSSGKFKVIH